MNILGTLYALGRKLHQRHGCIYGTLKNLLTCAISNFTTGEEHRGHISYCFPLRRTENNK